MAGLDDLKAGDEVVLLPGGYGHVEPELCTVFRVHKMHILIGGTKYRKRDGYQTGGGYRRGRIVMPSAELHDRIVAQRARNRAIAMVDQFREVSKNSSLKWSDAQTHLDAAWAALHGLGPT